MYTLMIDGIPIKCDTPQEALRLARSAADEGGRAHLRKSSTASEARWPNGMDARLVELLKTLERSPSGITAPALANAINLGGARGLGPIFAQLKRKLKARNLELKQVAERKREGTETRWVPKAKLNDVLISLESSL